VSHVISRVDIRHVMKYLMSAAHDEYKQGIFLGEYSLNKAMTLLQSATGIQTHNHYQLPDVPGLAGTASYFCIEIPRLLKRHFYFNGQIWADGHSDCRTVNK